MVCCRHSFHQPQSCYLVCSSNALSDTAVFACCSHWQLLCPLVSLVSTAGAHLGGCQRGGSHQVPRHRWQDTHGKGGVLVTSSRILSDNTQIQQIDFDKPCEQQHVVGIQTRPRASKAGVDRRHIGLRQGGKSEGGDVAGAREGCTHERRRHQLTPVQSPLRDKGCHVAGSISSIRLTAFVVSHATCNCMCKWPCLQYL